MSAVRKTDGDEKRMKLRAGGRKWRKNRDVNVVAAMRRAEAAALPPHKQPAKRQCLSCRAWFKSQWCGNLRCDVCKKRDGE